MLEDGVLSEDGIPYQAALLGIGTRFLSLTINSLRVEITTEEKIDS